MKKGELLKAITMLEKVLEYQDDNAAKTTLSYLYSEAGNMEKAIQYQVGDSTGRSVEETTFLYAISEANAAFRGKIIPKERRNTLNVISTLKNLEVQRNTWFFRPFMQNP